MLNLLDPAEFYRLLILVERMERGCQCDYDYRCAQCQRIIDAKEKATKIREQIADSLAGGG